MLVDVVPGDLFKRKGKVILVGHVNELGGECDDCVNHDFLTGRDPETMDRTVDVSWKFLRNVLEA